jgi:hypothetical protein
MIHISQPIDLRIRDQRIRFVGAALFVQYACGTPVANDFIREPVPHATPQRPRAHEVTAVRGKPGILRAVLLEVQMVLLAPFARAYPNLDV